MSNKEFWSKMLLVLAAGILLAFLTSAKSDSIVYVQGVALDTEIMGNYCEGWKDGWEDGYCYNQFACLAPIAPICPVPRINDEQGYKGGYQRGFVAGRKRYKKDRD